MHTLQVPLRNARRPHYTLYLFLVDYENVESWAGLQEPVEIQMGFSIHNAIDTQSEQSQRKQYDHNLKEEWKQYKAEVNTRTHLFQTSVT